MPNRNFFSTGLIAYCCLLLSVAPTASNAQYIEGTIVMPTVNSTETGALMPGSDYYECPDPAAGIPGKGVTVTAYFAEGAPVTVTTDQEGRFKIPAGKGPVKLVPSYVGAPDYTDPSFTSWDAYLISGLGRGSLSTACPYRRLAADLNNDGVVNEVDGQDLMNRYIVRLIPFPGPKWRFVPKAFLKTGELADHTFIKDFNLYVVPIDYAIENAQYPFKAVYHHPELGVRVSYPKWMDALESWPNPLPVCWDDTDWGFYMIRMGDINDNYAPEVFWQPLQAAPLSPSGPQASRTFANYDVTEAPGQRSTSSNFTLEPNTTYRIDIKGSVNAPVATFQIGLETDPSLLDVREIVPGPLFEKIKGADQKNFGLTGSKNNRSEFRAVWIPHDLQPVAFGPDQVLCSLVIRTKKKIDRLEDGFDISKALLPSIFFSDRGEHLPAQITITATPEGKGK